MPVTLGTSCSLVVFSTKRLFNVKKKIQSRGQIGEVAIKYLVSLHLTVPWDGACVETVSVSTEVLVLFG